jgi:integral membrane protein
MNFLVTTMGRLRAIGFLEGLSFIILLGVAMPLKYLAGQPEAVRVVGMAHGLLFLLYLAAAVQAAFEYKWTWRRTLLIAAASLVPFGPFYVDAKYLRNQSAPR